MTDPDSSPTPTPAAADPLGTEPGSADAGRGVPPGSPPPSRRAASAALLAAVLLGCVLRCLNVWHPFDAETLVEWREADYVQITRGFLREGGAPWFPRVDWRGTGSGLVEAEFPFLPWIGSLLQRVFGAHDEVLRVLSAAASIGGLLVFVRLARRLLAPLGSLVAVVLFAVNPLLFGIAGSLQPEPVMLLFTLLAADALLRFGDGPSTRRLAVACAWTSLAVLAKSPAVHLGLLTAWIVVRRHGVRTVFAPRTLACGAVALALPVAWYAWAHHLYRTTGLSLGMSNETHLLSLDLLREPWPSIRGNALFELRDVLGYGGAALVAAAALARSRAREFALAWYVAVLAFYALSANTSGDSWAFYYHALSVAPAALCMGAGVEALRTRGRAAALAGGLLAAVATLLLVDRTAETHDRRAARADLAALHAACSKFGRHLPSDALLAVRGGRRTDSHGHPVAFNASMAFAWLDRKGLNYAIEDASPATLEGLAARGCTHWLVQPADRDNPELAALAARLPTLASSDDGHGLVELAIPR